MLYKLMSTTWVMKIPLLQCRKVKLTKEKSLINKQSIQLSIFIPATLYRLENMFIFKNVQNIGKRLTQYIPATV